MKILGLLFLTMSAAFALERATFDSAGRITSLIDQGHRLEVLGHFVITADDGRQLIVQPHDQRSPIQRTGERQWEGSSLEVPGIRFAVSYEDLANGVRVDGRVTNAFPRHIRSVDFVLAVPRDPMLGGELTGAGVKLPVVKPTDPVFFRTSSGQLTLQSADGHQRVSVRTRNPQELTVVDTWNLQGRWYEIRIPLRTGRWNADEPLQVGAEISLSASLPTRAATVTLRSNEPRQEFLGFGANYCWVNTSPVVDYTLEHLRSTWVRFELKFAPWIAERDNPGPLLRRDFELMQRAQQAGTPWILSVWRLPEDFYVPQGGGSAMGHGRRIATARWEDFLEGVGSYLLYVKQHYGAEPDLFSFNEPDLGVDIIFSADEHRDANRMIGEYFAQLGLKTKLLLGDTANPRDRHLYALPTAADPSALKYIGGLSFHSWHSASPEQYAAWGDLAEWLQLPLFVGEAGMDPGAYRNRTYDSYTYGLREMKDHFDFVRHARVQVSLYWQFTNDYALVRTGPDGRIEPTGRFHLIQHLNNLTPARSVVYTTSSSDAEVHTMLFGNAERWTLHILNTAGACDIQLAGLPATRSWAITTTTEAAGFETRDWDSQAARLALPARSIVTLVGRR